MGKPKKGRKVEVVSTATDLDSFTHDQQQKQAQKQAAQQ